MLQNCLDLIERLEDKTQIHACARYCNQLIFPEAQIMLSAEIPKRVHIIEGLTRRQTEDQKHIK